MSYQKVWFEYVTSNFSIRSKLIGFATIVLYTYNTSLVYTYKN